MSDLAKLFATDPLKLTKTDLMSIVQEYRARRKQFILTGAAPKAEKKVSPKLTEALAATADLKLDL